MNAKTIARELARLPFSASLPETVLDRLATEATLRRFDAGSLLFREGAENDQFMVICAGRVALDMHVPGHGNIRILALGPGDMLAWSALLGGGRMTASGVALEDTEVVTLSGPGVLIICDSNPAFGYHLMRQVAVALANRLVATRLQLLDLFADTAPSIPLGPD